MDMKIDTLLQTRNVVDKNGIWVAKEIVSKTVWDTLAVENPTHAVISSKDEAGAAKKSAEQIKDIKRHVKSDDVVLDCGTGYGRMAKYLLPEMPLGSYVGVDSSYEMLSLFKQRYDTTAAEQKTPVVFLNADIHTMPLRDNSADVVLVCAVFLHNHKDVVKQAMAEIERVVKPGGTVLVYSSFPRSATCMGLQGALYQFLLNLLGRAYKNGPVRYYRKKEILKLFSQFAEVELRPVGYEVLPKTLIFLPKPLEIGWRVGIAKPINRLLEKITPNYFKHYFAVHYDVVAKK